MSPHPHPALTASFPRAEIACLVHLLVHQCHTLSSWVTLDWQACFVVCKMGQWCLPVTHARERGCQHFVHRHLRQTPGKTFGGNSVRLFCCTLLKPGTSKIGALGNPGGAVSAILLQSCSLCGEVWTGCGLWASPLLLPSALQRLSHARAARALASQSSASSCPVVGLG